jgi:sec-independent protein translocase protein TatA
MTGLTSPLHIAILLLIILLLFGAKRLPEIGSSLGKGMREFKGALMGEDEKKSTELVPPTPEQTPTPAPTPTATATTTPTPHEHDTV